MSVIFTSQTYSKYRSSGNDGNPYLYWATIDLLSQDTTANTSNILVTLYMSAKVGSGTLMWSTTKANAPTATITVEGTTYASEENLGSSSSAIFIDDGYIRRYSRSATGTVICQKTLTIQHDNNGQKYISVSFNWIRGSGTTIQYYPASFASNGTTVQLPSIPRNGTLDVPSAALLDGSTFVMVGRVISYANYYYDLSYTLDGNTVNVLTKQNINNTSYNFSVASSWLLANCSKAQANLVYTLTTYADAAGTTQIGDAVTAATVVMVDTDYYKPSISFSESIGSTPIVGYLVAGYSTMSVNYTATPPTGANIASVVFTPSYGSMAAYDTTQASGTASTNTLPASTQSGLTLNFTVVVTDSRGATYTEQSGNVYVVWPYDVPKITATAMRVSGNGSPTEDGAGTYVYLLFSASTDYTVDGQNGVRSVECTQGGNTYTSPSWVAQNADVSRTYVFTATDNVSGSTYSIKVGFAVYSADFYDDGTGLVMGAAFAGPLAEAGLIKLGNSAITEVNMMNAFYRLLATGAIVAFESGNSTNADNLLPKDENGSCIAGALSIAFATSNSGRTNWPTTGQRGVMLSIALSAGAGTYGVQFCYMNATNTLYMRYKSTSWQAWKSVTFS